MSNDAYLPAADRYDRMPVARLGRSGLKLSRISLGFWNNFGEDRAWATQRAIVRRAFDLGVTHLDLAANYGDTNGAAERTVGRILAADLRAHRDELVVATKAGYPQWPGPYGQGASRKHLLASLDASLGRLGLDHVDVYYSHRPDPDTPIEETASALADAVRSGKARYVGISGYSPEQTRAAAAALAAEGVSLVVHQPRYNMFDRLIEAELLPTLAELGLGAVVFSPLSQGMLTARYLDGIPADSRAATGQFLGARNITPEYLATIRALDAFAADRGQSVAQLALAWVLREPVVASAIIGASSVAQLEDSIAAVDAPPLTPEEIAALEPYAVDGMNGPQPGRPAKA